MTKFFKSFLCAFLCLFIALGTVHAKQLIVGVDANFRPFEFKNEKGEFTGFDVQLFDAIAKDLGLDYKWQTMDFNGIIPALQSNSIDAAIAGITIKSSREEVVDFSYPYYDAGLVILVREDNDEIKTIDDLKDKKVATKLATTSVDFLKSQNIFPASDVLFPEPGGRQGQSCRAPVPGPVLWHRFSPGQRTERKIHHHHFKVHGGWNLRQTV